MSVFFLDSSAIVKAYVTETGTNWIKGIIDPNSRNRIYVSILAGPEVISAITRRFNRGDISAPDARAASTLFRAQFSKQFLMVDLSIVLIESAMDIATKYGLRGFDAVHLACALTVNNNRSQIGLSVPVFISSDSALNQSAAIEGLAVDNPNSH